MNIKNSSEKIFFSADFVFHFALSKTSVICKVRIYLQLKYTHKKRAYLGLAIKAKTLYLVPTKSNKHYMMCF